MNGLVGLSALKSMQTFLTVLTLMQQLYNLYHISALEGAYILYDCLKQLIFFFQTSFGWRK